MLFLLFTFSLALILYQILCLSDYGVIGELSLDGRLRACRGILPMIIAAKKRKIKKLIVPFENINEAKLVHGIETIGLHDLREVIQYVEGKI